MAPSRSAGDRGCVQCFLSITMLWSTCSLAGNPGHHQESRWSRDEGDNVDIAPRIEWPADRHLTRRKREQRGDRPFAPPLHDRGAGEFGTVAIPLKQPLWQAAVSH
jgi:hypothetical protein